jgi:hypothetical protein
MTPEEFGLWNYARSVSYESKIVYLSGREVAKAFSGISKNVVYRIADQLVAKGWFRELCPYSRNPKTGTLIPRQVYALDHEEWVAECSATQCRPVPVAGQALVPVAGRTCPDSSASCPGSGPDLSRNQEQYLKDVESNSARESESAKRTKQAGGAARKAKTKTSHTSSSEDQTMAGKIQAKLCSDFNTTGNPYLLSAIVKELENGRSPKEIYDAAKTTKVEWNDVMVWKTLADNLPTALIQMDQDREQQEHTRRVLEATILKEQQRAEAEHADVLAAQQAEAALVEECL